MSWRYLSILSWLWLGFPLTASAETLRPGGLPEGIDPGLLQVLNIDGKPPQQPLQLPLTHTDVKITIAGFVAQATVTQNYTNPFEKPIEAVYVFPLPHKAAVDSMTMHVGDRVIHGLIKKREEARQIYQQAKAEGKRTALLEQERPNIFTQSVGNIMPGDKISIEITYVDMLDYRDEGAFELVFPMVVGPRYIPGTTAQGRTGGGFAENTDRVPDASRITPPVLKPSERSGHDIALTVDLDAHLKIQGLHSISHRIDITELSDTRRTITLRSSDTIPNKDFVLRYEVAGKAPEMAVIAHHDPQQGGYFTLIALPQRHIDDASTVPRDLIFILDTSGSMYGLPLEKSKEAMYRLLKGMRSSDRFNVLRFAGDTGTLWPEPRPKTPQNVATARSFIESMQGGGGTEMVKGINEALSQPAEGGRLRIAFLLTDGYVGNEAEILASIEHERRGARVFTLGVGSSVNHYLLDQAAVIGLGEAFYIRQDEDATAVIDKFFTRVDRPNLAHIDIDWKGLDVSALTPTRIPDLWQGQPIMVHGRYQRGGDANIAIHGVLGSKEQTWTIPVDLPSNAPENAVMATVWARAKVQELMFERSRNSNPGEQGVAEITDLGLKYRIMTQWTSFVAVEEQVVNKGGMQQTVVQPVELPEGVDYKGVFGANGGETAQMPSPIGGLTRGFTGGNRHFARGLMLDRGESVTIPSAKLAGAGNAQNVVTTVIAMDGVDSDITNTAAIAPMAPPQSAPVRTETPKETKDSGNLLTQPTAGAAVKAEKAASLRDKKDVLSLQAEPAVAKFKGVDATDISDRCHYKALSVSGALSYPEVEQQLRQLWSGFCVDLLGHITNSGTVGVNLVVGTNGTVKMVTIPLQSPLTPDSLTAIEAAFKKLSFKHSDAGETKISLVLIINL